MSENKKEELETKPEFVSKIGQIRGWMEELENRDNSNCLIFFTIGSIDSWVAYNFFNIIRKEPKIDKLVMILESGGGLIEDALKIAQLCKKFSNNFSVIVPYYAKSAATLIALYADELILCKAGELGPVDPQVKHPVFDMTIPASSIRNALEFIESSVDPYIKMTMADKFDPFIIGACNQAIEEVKIYLKEVPNVKNAENNDEILEAFTTKYLDHGYPITHEICEELKLCSITSIDNSLEDLVYNIHQVLLNLMILEDLTHLILTRTQIQFELRKSKTKESFEDSAQLKTL